jgi:hypothetical protein
MESIKRNVEQPSQYSSVYQKIKQNDYSRFLSWGIVILSILFVAAIRVRLLDIPLERDEGEFAYMGQLILQGVPPYSLAYNMKLPGVYVSYALIMTVFGQTPSGIYLIGSRGMNKNTLNW